LYKAIQITEDDPDIVDIVIEPNISISDLRMGLTLRFNLGLEYPSKGITPILIVVPDIRITNPIGISSKRIKDLHQHLKQKAEEHKGSIMVYDLAVDAREYLERNAGNLKSLYEDMMEVKQKEEQEIEMKVMEEKERKEREKKINDEIKTKDVIDDIWIEKRKQEEMKKALKKNKAQYQLPEVIPQVTPPKIVVSNLLKKEESE
jgi:hypothetical protein